jgi:hypothetical protein
LVKKPKFKKCSNKGWGLTCCVQEGPVISGRYMEIRGLQAGPAYGVKIRAVVANCHSEADNELVATQTDGVSPRCFKNMFSPHLIPIKEYIFVKM